MSWEGVVPGPPPTAQLKFANSDHQNTHGAGSWNLMGAVMRKTMWPTPIKTDAQCGTSNQVLDGVAEGRYQNNLTREVLSRQRQAGGRVQYPTPMTGGITSGGGSSSVLGPQLAEAMAAEAEARGIPDGGKLNPMWVEWLMGWPMGWTALQPLETGRFRQWLSQHGITSPSE